ncbi:hypothetical protein D3C71_2040850 [compost metagenome]
MNAPIRCNLLSLRPFLDQNPRRNNHGPQLWITFKKIQRPRFRELAELVGGQPGSHFLPFILGNGLGGGDQIQARIDPQ